MGDNDFQINALKKRPLREDITKRDPSIFVWSTAFFMFYLMTSVVSWE